MSRHFRHALRLFVRQPLFTLTAVLSLAIGIGANVTIFSVANTLLLAPTSGMERQSEIVDVGLTRSNSSFDTMSYPNFLDLKSRNRTLTGMYALEFEPKPMSLGGDEGATRVYGQIVSAGFFDVLGVAPVAGDTFHDGDDRPGTPLRRVVISHAFWQRQFGGNPAIAGTDIVLNGDRFTITAVAPEGFQGTTILAPDMWVPVTSQAKGFPSEASLNRRTDSFIVAGGRLKPGVTIEQARADLGAIVAQLHADFPNDVGENMRAAVFPTSKVPGEVGGAVAPIVAVLGGIVGLVLLLACTNLAGLLIARAAGRAREMAVRVALGARRRTLMAQMLAETLLLFAGGAMVAAVLSIWMTGFLWSLLPPLPFPIHLAFAFDWRVLAFTVAVALLTSVFTGLAPALQASRPNLNAVIKMDQSAPARQRMRAVLVAAQMGLCLMLLVVAGLMMRSLHNAASVDPGMRVDGVSSASIDLSVAGYTSEQSPIVTERVRQALAAIPGVATVGVGAMEPLSGGGLGLGDVRKRGDAESANLFDADWSVVSPEYLPALEIPVVRGRNFTSADRRGAADVVIINEHLAAQVWPGEDPIGRQIEYGDFRPGRDGNNTTATVVGIARDSKYRWIGESPRQFIYVPLGQYEWRRPKFFIALDSRADARADLTPQVRLALKQVDPNLPLIELQRMRSLAELGMLPQTIGASVAGSLGTLALLLAAVGLYGVMAFAVTRRTREIGVRIALGADHGAVARMILRQGLTLTAGGGIAGLLLSAVAATGLSSAGVLFGVSPFDPLTFAGTAAALLAVAGLAAYVPARRASRIDPLTALRSE
jgi:predicted permease